MEMDSIDALLAEVSLERGPVVVMTGAGVSAESGIPTFRGADGYWRVGSRNYQATELATGAAFAQMPDDVWAWYLYRRGVCRGAAPNAAHRAIAALEHALGERFLLLTQNVDGLHRRAGSSAERTYEIHGNIDLMRCSNGCSRAIVRIPEEVEVDWPKGRTLQAEQRSMLRCASCGARTRPHVLWFDEHYDEEHFRFDSSLRAAAQASLLIVIGTAGQTNLPMHVGRLVNARGAPLIVINLEASPFTEMAERGPHGLFLQGTAGEHVPPLMERVAALA